MFVIGFCLSLQAKHTVQFFNSSRTDHGAFPFHLRSTLSSIASPTPSTLIIILISVLILFTYVHLLVIIGNTKFPSIHPHHYLEQVLSILTNASKFLELDSSVGLAPIDLFKNGSANVTCPEIFCLTELRKDPTYSMVSQVDPLATTRAHR